jgi:hypothetical protein
MCTSRHDERPAARLRAAVRACAALALALIALPDVAQARTDDAQRPRVVWAGAGRLYVLAPDSGAFAPRMRVRVLEKHREVARGEVTEVMDGVLASVALTSGGVRTRAKLDRLEVIVEPAEPRAVATLRIGLPAASRTGLVPPCPASRLDPGALPRTYRAESLAVDAIRLVAADSAVAGVAWPETLLVRFFGDRADEEIALERGDLEVAVFWPGEPSARARGSALGRDALRGTRARGVLVASSAPADTALADRVAPDMAALNTELFGGDLLALRSTEGSVSGPGSVRSAVRYSVDPSVPGQRAIERFLNRAAGAAARPGERAVRITFADEAAPGPGTSAWAGHDAVPLFALRCPVLCAPARAGDVLALGADAFANLLDCATTGMRP